MSAEDLQNSDGHSVNVAGHGLNPSPVPPEPEERPSLTSGFSAKRARHG